MLLAALSRLNFKLKSLSQAATNIIANADDSGRNPEAGEEDHIFLVVAFAAEVNFIFMPTS